MTQELNEGFQHPGQFIRIDVILKHFLSIDKNDRNLFLEFLEQRAVVSNIYDLQVKRYSFSDLLQDTFSNLTKMAVILGKNLNLYWRFLVLRIHQTSSSHTSHLRGISGSA